MSDLEVVGTWLVIVVLLFAAAYFIGHFLAAVVAGSLPL